VSALDLPIGPPPPPELPAWPAGGALRRLTRAETRRDEAALIQAAKDFESVLLHQLLEQMAQTVPDAGLLSSAMSRQVQSMFWSHLAGEIANQGGMGLWKGLYEQWARAGAEAGELAPAAAKEPSE